jgi:hypothetical protein
LNRGPSSRAGEGRRRKHPTSMAGPRRAISDGSVAAEV